MKIYFSILLIVFFFSNLGLAQISEEKKLNSELSEEDRIQLLYETAKTNLSVKPSYCLTLATEAEELIGKPHKKDFKSGVSLADVTYLIGEAKLELNENDDAVKAFIKSYQIADKYDYPFGKEKAEKKLAALGVNAKSWFSRKKHGITHLGINEKFKGVTSNIKEATKGISFREKEVRMRKYANNGYEAANDYNYALAIEEYEKALALSKELGEPYISLEYYLTIADLLVLKTSLPLAHIAYDSALQFIAYTPILNADTKLTDSIIAIKKQYIIEEQPTIIEEETTIAQENTKIIEATLPQDSIEVLENEIKTSLLNQEEAKAKINSLDEVATQSAQEGDYEKALQFKELYFAAQKKYFQDSISNQARIFQLEEKRRLQAIEIKTQEQLLQQEKDTRFFLIASSILLACLALVSLYAFRNKKKSHKTLQKTYNDLENTLLELKTTQLKLIESEKMASLGQLTAGIAHEINNPINFVTANISPLKQDIADVEEFYVAFEQVAKQANTAIPSSLLQLKDKLDLEFLIEEMYALLNGIEEGAERTKSIVDSFRNFARLDEEGFKKVDLKESIQSCLNLLKPKTSKNILFKTDFPENTICECQPSKINQVFFHLLNNATKAIDYQQGLVEVSIVSEANNIQIIVRDNGCGIDKGIASKIFDPFFTTRDVGEGKGLGLSIAYGIIKEHNGEITFNSTTGEGSYTEFIVKLPCKEYESIETENQKELILDLETKKQEV